MPRKQPQLISEADLAAIASRLIPLLQSPALEAHDDLPDKLNALDALKTRLHEVEERIPETIKYEMADIRGQISELTDEICHTVVERGETVSGASLQAVFFPGRATWDTKALDAYSISVPELQKYRKLGKPYAAIRQRS